MNNIDKLCQNIEEFCKLAEDNNDAISYPSWQSTPSPLELRQYNKKYQEVHMMLMEIKRIADIVDVRYKSVKDDNGWLTKIWDTNFKSTMHDLKKARKILEYTAKDLDKHSTSWF